MIVTLFIVTGIAFWALMALLIGVSRLNLDPIPLHGSAASRLLRARGSGAHFHDPREFEWVKPLEQAFPTIKTELLSVLSQDGRGFKVYLSEGQERLDGWNTFNFFFFGKRFEENQAARGPTTWP